MKKNIKFLCDFILGVNSKVETLKSDQVQTLSAREAKGILLTCPYPLRFFGSLDDIYLISSYGGTVGLNEYSLDHAVDDLNISLLMILTHESCSAVKRVLKADDRDIVDSQLKAAIAPAFAGGKGRKYRDNAMKHLDYQIALALERYRTKVKDNKLAVAGLYCDENAVVHLVNYNGIFGGESLAHALPDVDTAFFL